MTFIQSMFNRLSEVQVLAKVHPILNPSVLWGSGWNIEITEFLQGGEPDGTCSIYDLFGKGSRFRKGCTVSVAHHPVRF